MADFKIKDFAVNVIAKFNDINTKIKAIQASISANPSFKAEYKTKYIARANFGFTPANNTLATITFDSAFTKIPMVVVCLHLNSTSVRAAYVMNITTTGFQIATNYGPDLQGVSYEAWVIN